MISMADNIIECLINSYVSSTYGGHSVRCDKLSKLTKHRTLIGSSFRWSRILK